MVSPKVKSKLVWERLSWWVLIKVVSVGYNEKFVKMIGNIIQI